VNPNVFSGPRIYAREETAMENLARYANRASFSQERMSYVEEDRMLLSTTGQRTARSRRSLTPWNGWSRLCRDGLTSPTRESRWSAAMATTYKQQCFPRQLEQAEPRRPHTVHPLITFIEEKEGL